jgi:non-heme chloroperoxidase
VDHSRNSQTTTAKISVPETSEIRAVQADDHQPIQLWRTGRGRPLILLHEWTADHRAWDRFAPTLADRFTVHAWDARGHGATGAIPAPEAEPATVERMARDLKQVIDALALDEAPLLVGHSMGALTVWRYVALYGCRGLGGLCIIDQSPKLVTDADWRLGIYGDFPETRNQAFMAGLAADFPNTVLKLLADGHNSRARERIEADSPGIRRLRERLGRLDPAPLITCWDSLAAADFRPVLPTIDVPCLLIYGSASNYYGVAVAEYVQQAIPGSVLHLYEGGDHSPHVGQRDRFLAELTAFGQDAMSAR